MDLAARYDFTIEQGATFSRTFRYVDSSGTAIDISSYTIRMIIRSALDGYILATSLGSSPTITITISDVPGVFIISMTATDTAALSFERGVYDIELVTGTTVVRFAEGFVYLSKEVTK